MPGRTSIAAIYSENYWFLQQHAYSQTFGVEEQLESQTTAGAAVYVAH